MSKCDRNDGCPIAGKCNADGMCHYTGSPFDQPPRHVGSARDYSESTCCGRAPGACPDCPIVVKPIACRSATGRCQLSTCSTAGECLTNNAPVGCPIAAKVAVDILRRAEFGLSKYGVNLARTDLSRRQWLQHAYEEALDSANYLQVLIQREPL